MALNRDEKSVAITAAMQRAAEMTPAELAELVGIRRQSTAASDAETVDMDVIESTVEVANKHLGGVFNVGKLTKICHRLDPQNFPTIPSAHSKLMSIARWLKNNRGYTMPVKPGADRTTIAYPPAVAAQ